MIVKGKNITKGVRRELQERASVFLQACLAGHAGGWEGVFEGIGQAFRYIPASHLTGHQARRKICKRE